jgi:glycine oxidase
MPIGRLHLITDSRPGRDVLAVVAAGLAAGVDTVQVRVSDATTDREAVELATKVLDLCRERGVACLVNDRVHVALAIGADGAHVGADDLPVKAARRILGPRAILGATARDPETARKAVSDGASYLGVGPTYATSTKDGLPDPIGPAGVQAVAEAVSVPVIAIGGITAARVTELRKAHGVAVVGAISDAHDPARAVAELRRAVIDTTSGKLWPPEAPEATASGKLCRSRGSVAVVGGGIIGLSIAWRCRQRGLHVTVYADRDDPKASTVAAGMLAPSVEAYPGEEKLHELMAESARRWPDFAAEITNETGIDVGYRDEGTLLVALTDDDLRELRHRHAGEVRPMTTAELRTREPLLSPRIRGGAYAPRDRQVDPRKLIKALGMLVRTSPRAELSTLDEETIVIAAGTGTRELTGLPVRPVKGQIVRLTAGRPPVRHVIRGYARGRPVYIVPRDDGEVVIGATEEERGADTSVTAGGVLDLLRPAVELVPELAECAIAELSAGSRPGTPDNAPFLGRLDDRTIVAAGHHRNGVLLAPVTADAIAELVATGTTPTLIEPFSPTREARCA